MSKKTLPRIGSDEGFVILAAVRYALTRASYAVTLVADYVTRQWPMLDDNTKFTIVRDVQETLSAKHADNFCVHDLYRREWEQFLRVNKAPDSKPFCLRCLGRKVVGDHHGGQKPCPHCEG